MIGVLSSSEHTDDDWRDLLNCLETAERIREEILRLLIV